MSGCPVRRLEGTPHRCWRVKKSCSSAAASYVGRVACIRASSNRFSASISASCRSRIAEFSVPAGLKPFGCDWSSESMRVLTKRIGTCFWLFHSRAPCAEPGGRRMMVVMLLSRRALPILTSFARAWRRIAATRSSPRCDLIGGEKSLIARISRTVRRWRWCSIRSHFAASVGLHTGGERLSTLGRKACGRGLFRRSVSEVCGDIGLLVVAEGGRGSAGCT